MEKELTFKAKSYLLDNCYGDVYVKYFTDTDIMFIKFNFDGIEIKITVDDFIEKIHYGSSVIDMMNDVLKKCRFILCNIISNRYFKDL